MYLSKLELHGFKSFADRTVLHFDPGITAIVGPNGCGKSNIVDAVRWAIGEQRARILRSEKMENVIFNGTANRKAIGLGEVLLTIENNRGILPTEYSEVELGRRLYRSGDSEYLMNGVQCRLKDITDLFMDTGMGAGAYSVIELKMIDEILSDNADDRRRLFEEAAGITRYKLRRRQTLTKLDSTQVDLTRIRDLTEEIGKQVRSLRRQAQRAEKYKEYSERLHFLELALAYLEYSRLMRQRERLDTEVDSLRDQSDKTGSTESREESSLEQLREDLKAREADLSERQAAFSRHLGEVRSLETERRLAEERLESARREIARTAAEQNDAARKRISLQQELADLQSAVEDADPELANELERLSTLQNEMDARRSEVEKIRAELESLDGDERRLESQRSDFRRAIDRLVNRRELLEQDLERTKSLARAVEESLSELRQRVAHAEAHREAVARNAESAASALEAAAEHRRSLQNKIDESNEVIRALERRRDALDAEVQLLESMLTSYDEFSGAVQFLSTSDWSDSATASGPDALQTVSDVLACDERDRIALDSALGSFAECLAVRSESEAQRAIDALRREDQGRATFILLDRLRKLSVVPREEIEAEALVDRVRTSDPEHRKLADILLRHCYVVDSLEEAQILAPAAPDSVRIFARTGEWIDGRGIIHGGSRQTGPSAAGGRLGRREQLDGARAEFDNITSQLQSAEGRLAHLLLELANVPYEVCRGALREAEQRLTEAEKETARLESDLRSSGERRQELTQRELDASAALQTIADQFAETETKLHEAGDALDVLRSRLEEVQRVFQLSREASDRASAVYNEANVRTVEVRNRTENLHRDLERTKRTLSELDAGFEQRKERIIELEEKIRSSESRLHDCEEKIGSLEGQRRVLEEAVAYADEAVQQTREAIHNVEAELRGIRRRREHLMKEEHQRDVRIAEIQTRAEDLVAHIEDEFGIDLPRAVEAGKIVIPDELDENDARSEVADLRKSIRSLGAVNELALETYEEEKTRLEFLTQQQEDLENAERKLVETIEEINTTASEQFLETYELIRANFQRIFSHLFGNDTSADLVLEDPENPLETPIDISARPRGKRPTSISQLSGGEKTLTAIALLFGIYLVKPSPFCILDEVDAPLDDANVERFMRLIREFSVDTQFILVTHNKRTMEAADRLYGITMQETGVSRLVGVKFDEAVDIVDPASQMAA